MSNTNNMGDLQPKSNTTKIVLIVGIVGVVLVGIALLIFFLTRTSNVTPTEVKVPTNDTVPTLTDELNRWDISEQIFRSTSLFVTTLPDSIVSGVDDSKLLVTVLKYLRDNGYKLVVYPQNTVLLRQNKILFATNDTTASLIPSANTNTVGFRLYTLK
jgi:hypothetical protein